MGTKDLRACVCGHTRMRHEPGRSYGRCLTDGCSCRLFMRDSPYATRKLEASEGRQTSFRRPEKQ